MKSKSKTYPWVLDESAKAIALGVLVGMVAGMVMVADPREVAEVKGAEKVKTPPSLGSVSEGVAVVGVASVLLLKLSVTGELAIVTVDDIDVASVTSLVDADTPGDVVSGSTKLPSVVVKASVEELAGVGALFGSDVDVVVAVMFKVAVVWVWSVVVVAVKRTPDVEIAELGATNTSVGPLTPLVPRTFPPGNPEELCSEESFGMCDGSTPVSLPVLVATEEVGRKISVDVAGGLAPLGDSTSSEGSGVCVSCDG